VSVRSKSCDALSLSVDGISTINCWKPSSDANMHLCQRSGRQSGQWPMGTDMCVVVGGMFCCLGLGVGRVGVVLSNLLLIFCVSLVRSSMWFLSLLGTSTTRDSGVVWWLYVFSVDR
jgi:hypothetical protein